VQCSAARRWWLSAVRLAALCCLRLRDLFVCSSAENLETGEKVAIKKITKGEHGRMTCMRVGEGGGDTRFHPIGWTTLPAACCNSHLALLSNVPIGC